MKTVLCVRNVIGVMYIALLDKATHVIYAKLNLHSIVIALPVQSYKQI